MKNRSALIALPFVLVPIIGVPFVMPDINDLAAGKLFFFHVPSAWTAALGFFLAGIFSVLYIIKRDRTHNTYDRKAYISAKAGIIFTVIAIISGSVWAKIAWNSFWNWDIRQTTILFLLLFYLAYLSLYSLINDSRKKGLIGSVYLIFTFILMPFFMFILPRSSGKTLHPDAVLNKSNRIMMDNTIIFGLGINIVAFTVLYAILCIILYNKKK